MNVKATDDFGLRAIVFVDRLAGTIVAGRKLTGKAVEFRQRLSTSAAARDLDLQVILTDDGGHQTRRAQRLSATARPTNQPELDER